MVDVIVRRVEVVLLIYVIDGFLEVNVFLGIIFEILVIFEKFDYD